MENSDLQPDPPATMEEARELAKRNWQRIMRESQLYLCQNGTHFESKHIWIGVGGRGYITHQNSGTFL